MLFDNLSAIEIRLEMEKLGWDSHDRLNRDGWINGYGYSIWFERYNWHHRHTVLLTGRSVVFHKHTNDLTKIVEITRLCAEQALLAYKDFPTSLPYQNSNGDTAEDVTSGDWNDPKAIIKENLI